MLKRWWDRAFLDERPTASLGLFRIGLALVVGLHVFPTLFQLHQNYLAGSFREYNVWFFPVGLLKAVDRAPDWTIWLAAAAFTCFWFLFLIGFKTQKSGLLMMLASYFFYARNAIHIGTLSWDILLVTLFLAVLTPYLGDSFSADAVLSGETASYRRKRPYFVQRLLQLQVAQTYFYTGLSKFTAGGNWIADNPYWYRMNNPATGVMRETPLKAFLAARPDLCHALGLTCLVFELTIPLFLFWRRTRLAAIIVGCVFQLYLWGTMHVPTIFIFLFPQLLLLFVAPEKLVSWLDARRRAHAARGRHVVLYDGWCCFCEEWARKAEALDFDGRLELADLRAADLKAIDPRLTKERCESSVHLVERGGRITSGFEALKRLSVLLPALWPAAPLVHLPGAAAVGEPAYEAFARLRFKLQEPR